MWWQIMFCHNYMSSNPQKMPGETYWYVAITHTAELNEIMCWLDLDILNAQGSRTAYKRWLSHNSAYHARGIQSADVVRTGCDHAILCCQAYELQQGMGVHNVAHLREINCTLFLPCCWCIEGILWVGYSHRVWPFPTSPTCDGHLYKSRTNCPWLCTHNTTPQQQYTL